MRIDKGDIGKRLQLLREHGGLSRKAFGALFTSKENTVYEWEHGGYVPRLSKLLRISVYFGVSLDWLLAGRLAEASPTERLLAGAAGSPASTPSMGSGILIARFHTLSSRHKERVIGYLEALRREGE